jgi:tripartite-type tricarboxylate transporter receptor subunit TctC
MAERVARYRERLGHREDDVVKLRCAALAAAFLFLAAGPVLAFPDRPNRLIVGFPPGGSADLVARAIQPIVEKRLGQPLIIENKAGAGGVIAADVAAKATPDGHMIALAGAGALAVNVSLNEKMPYDPVKDLAPVTLLAAIPFVLIAPASSPANSVAEVAALAKAKPDSFSIGHGGNGTAMHLSAQLFNQMAGVSATLVPYRGSTPVASDVLAGHVPLGISDITSAIALIRAGQIKALGVSTLRRTTALPEVATISESGLPGYESIGWFGIVASAGTPPEIVAKLNAAIVAALDDPGVKERLIAVGVEPAPMSPEKFGAFIRSEIVKWSDVIAKAGPKAN